MEAPASTSAALDLLEVLPEATLLVSGRGEVLAANRPAASMLGSGADELRGRSLSELTTDPPEEVERRLRAWSRSGTMVPGSLSWKTAGGEPLDCRCDGAALRPGGVLLLRCLPRVESNSLFRSLNGELEALRSEHRRINQANERLEERVRERTAQLVRNAERLRESRERFRALVQNASDVITVLDTDGAILYESPAIERVLGYDPEELVGRNVLGYVHPEDARRAAGALGGVVRDRAGVSRFLDLRVRHKDGSWRCMEVVANNRLRDPSVHGIVVNSRDVTERKRAEEELRRSEARYRAVVETTPDAVLTVAADGTIRSFNPGAERIFGYGAGEVIGEPFTLLVPERYRSRHRAGLERYLETGAGRGLGRTVELVGLRKGGEEFPIELSLGEMREGESPLLTGIVRDVTGRKEAEEALRRSERSLAAAQRIAHVGSSEYVVERDEVRWSDELYRILGCAPGQFVPTYETFMGFVHPEDRGLLGEAFRRTFSDEEPGGAEYRVVRPDGEVRVVRSRYEVDRDGAGRPVKVIGASQDVTEQKAAEARLREAEERYRTLVEQIPAAVYLFGVGMGGRVSYMSPRVEDITGYPPEEYTSDPGFFMRMLHPEDRGRVMAEGRRYADRVLAGETDETLGLEYRVCARDGRVVWIRGEAGLVRDAEGRPRWWQGIMLDITEHKRAEEALRRSEERFRSLVQNASDVVAVVDAAGITRYVSPAVERVLGYAPESADGHSFLESAVIHPEDRERVKGLFARLVANPGASVTAEFRLRHADGSWRYFEAIGKNLLPDPSVGGIVVNYRDITERKAFEEQLRYRAFHDPLTGLPNRALFVDRLERALARTDRRGVRVAVLFMDLDNFKVLNDSLGHEFGDALLTAVGDRLRRCLRPEDTAARFGGDEFVVLLEEIPDSGEAGRIAGRIRRELRRPFHLEGQEVFVTASIGVALGGAAQDGSGDLLRNADLAMYRAKAAGRDRHATFEPGMHAGALKRMRLEGDLRRAVGRGELEVYYQPQVRTASGEIAGMEALVRWNHPTRGLLEPDEFIPLAEETGLIVEVGAWVLGEACRHARGWRATRPDGEPPWVSVNLSARQFHDPGLVQTVARALRQTGLDPRRLVLEITETVLMGEARDAVVRLGALKDLGAKIALDDFGTGYSSLSYLRRFPTDFLKLDRLFVEALDRDSEARRFVLGIVNFAQFLRLEVIAEGVESVRQLESLRTFGCNLVQGYYLSRPLPAGGAAELLATGLDPGLPAPPPGSSQPA